MSAYQTTAVPTHKSQAALAAPKLDEIVDGDVIEASPGHEGRAKT
jgi:hypothetical protein